MQHPGPVPGAAAGAVRAACARHSPQHRTPRSPPRKSTNQKVMGGGDHTTEEAYVYLIRQNQRSESSGSGFLLRNGKNMRIVFKV